MTPVVVPVGGPPEFSALVVLYGGGRVALRALATLVAHTGVPFEVVVVDNASADGSGALVCTLCRNAHFVPLPANVGFGPAMNMAADRARAPRLLLLNPDVQFTPGWYEPLADALGSERVAAVSPVLLDPDGSVQEAGADIDADGFTHPRLVVPTGPAVVEYASAACLLVSRDAFGEVGGFDPAFVPAYFEDADLAMRWSEIGRDVVVHPGSRVLHDRGGGGGGARALAAAQRNHARFRERWAARLAEKR